MNKMAAMPLLSCQNSQCICDTKQRKGQFHPECTQFWHDESAVAGGFWEKHHGIVSKSDAVLMCTGVVSFIEFSGCLMCSECTTVALFVLHVVVRCRSK